MRYRAHRSQRRPTRRSSATISSATGIELPTLGHSRITKLPESDGKYNDQRRPVKLRPRGPRNFIHLGFDGNQKVREPRPIHQAITDPHSGQPQKQRNSPLDRYRLRTDSKIGIDQKCFIETPRPRKQVTQIAMHVTGEPFALDCAYKLPSAATRSKTNECSRLHCLTWMVMLLSFLFDDTAFLREHRDRHATTLSWQHEQPVLNPNRPPRCYSEQGRRESNPQPPVLETGALPIELHPSMEKHWPITSQRFQSSIDSYRRCPGKLNRATA